MSGNNQPYEPELAEKPSEVVAEPVYLTPCDPEINWKTLPASLNTVVVT